VEGPLRRSVQLEQVRVLLNIAGSSSACFCRSHVFCHGSLIIIVLFCYICGSLFMLIFVFDF
jgi:hypothetical protein